MKNYDKIFKTIIENNNLVNSYIFYGDNKLAEKKAKEFSKMINGKDENIYFIDKKKITIDDIRDIVDSSKSVPRNSYKIFIINNFDNIQLNADNALLKTLESCKERVIFILIVKNLSTLNDTIKSRCQKFYFREKNPEASSYLISYFSRDFFQGFYGIPVLIKEKDIIKMLEDFVLHLYTEECDDYQVYNLIRQAIKDIKFGLEKQLVVDNLMIQLKIIS